MKKIIYLFLCLLILISGIIPAYAAENSVNVGFILTSSDADKIINYSRTAEVSAVANEAKLKVNEGYYLHALLSPDIVKSVREGAEIKNLISENYSIIVPTENGYIKYRKDNNGNVFYSGTAEFNESTKNTNLVNISTVKGILNSEKYKDSTDVVVLDAPMYATNFVYFSADDVEYLIPFSSRPDFTGLENGKLYKATDCMAVLSASWGDVSANGNENCGYGATLSETHDPTKIYVISGIIICFIVISSVIAVLSLRKFKKAK